MHSVKQLFVTVLCLLLSAQFAQAQPTQPQPYLPPIESFTHGPLSLHDLMQQRIDYYQDRFTSAYNNHGHKNANWDSLATRFLKQFEYYYALHINTRIPYLRIPDSVQMDRINELAIQLMTTRCEDPLVLFAIFKTAFHDSCNEKQFNLYINSVNRLKDLDYSPEIKFMIIQLVDELSRKRDGARYLPNIRFPKNTIIDHIVPLLAYAKANPETRRTIYNNHEYFFGRRDKLTLNFKKAIFAKLQKHEDKIDPWLYNLALGNHHINVAWQHRGDGYASTVTDDGWQNFKKHLRLAVHHLRKAHEIAPSLPEPATDLITAAMAGSDALQRHEDSWHWLRLAIAAQHDHTMAYAKALDAVRPRWGGSLKEMYHVGKIALSSDRFDTRAPLMLRNTVHTMINETESLDCLRIPTIQTDLDNLLTKLIDQPNYKSGRFELIANRIAFAHHTNKHDLARELYLKNKDNIQMHHTALIDHQPLTAQRIFTIGQPYTDKLFEAMAYDHQQRKHKAAINIYNTILTDLKDNPDTTSYERRAIEEFKQLAEINQSFKESKWTELINPNQPYAGWKTIYGQWSIEEDGLRGNSYSARLPQGLAVLHKIDFGKRIKIRGKATLHNQLDAELENQYPNIAVFYHADHFNNNNLAETSFSMYPLINQVSVQIDNNNLGPDTIDHMFNSNTVNFELHITQHETKAFIDGEEIYTFPHIDAPKTSETRLAIGAWTWVPGVSVTFHSLQVKPYDDPTPPPSPID
ncbi:hypothetical protein [Poriferisphaera sp. WC338]|uniref:hypothetical protein n=1 Tax=Poriferisphaera sp. WC338 TaxID=3425129 RepID=UPI003D8185A4